MSWLYAFPPNEADRLACITECRERESTFAGCTQHPLPPRRLVSVIAAAAAAAVRRRSRPLPLVLLPWKDSPPCLLLSQELDAPLRSWPAPGQTSQTSRLASVPHGTSSHRLNSRSQYRSLNLSLAPSQSNRDRSGLRLSLVPRHQNRCQSSPNFSLVCRQSLQRRGP